MTERETPKRRRFSRLFIDKPFQYRLLKLMLAIWAIQTFFFSGIIYFYREHLVRFYRLEPRADSLPLVSPDVLFGLAVLGVILFGLGLVVIVGAYLSHQIAGPLFRVKRSLERASQGDYDFEIRFRERDFLEDLPSYFNNMLLMLKEKEASDLRALEAIEESLDQPTKARALIRQLRERKGKRLDLAANGCEVAVKLH